MPVIDERIVAAKFDASDFEKGAVKVIKKLDELKESFDMKDAQKNVKDFADKTGSAMENVTGSLDKLTERITTFKGMIKQQILSGLAEEVSGVFIKMERAVTGFVRSISTAQISVGMSKYEQMLTSVRTMIAAGDTEDAAYEAIGRLGDYADQTSYSLDQMTSALSKMRAAGVDLDTATKAVEGISNACANAGINASDASRAFYNLAQAYSSGTLKYTDYRSLELLNMTTKQFKEQLLEAAEQAGTLKKVSEGVYKTVNKTNKKVTAGKTVTVENLTDALRYNFVDNEAMNKLFGEKFFFDEAKWDEIAAKYKNKSGELTDEAREKALKEAKELFGEVAVNAYFAAREARSFTDVINTLKDVISRGWADTFEHLFGKLEDATKFFTRLVEDGTPFANAIYAISEWRNAIFESQVDAENEEIIGKMFRESIINITDALGILLQTIESIAPEASEFGVTIGDISIRIRNATIKIKDAATAFREWMNGPSMKEGLSRIELIREIIANISSVITIAGKLIGIAFNAIEKAFETLAPVFDGVLLFFDKLTKPLSDLDKNESVFKNITYSIENLFTVLKPVTDLLGKIIGFLGDIAAFFFQMSIDTLVSNISFVSDMLGLIVELIFGESAQSRDAEGEGSILGKITKMVVELKNTCEKAVSTVKEFFLALTGDLKALFGLTEENQNGNIFSRLTNFFETNQFLKDAKTWVDRAIVDVTEWVKDIPNKLMNIGLNIYNAIAGLFYFDEKDATKGKTDLRTPLKKWLDQAIVDVKAFMTDLPNKIIEGVGKVTNWVNDVFEYLLGDKKVEKKTTVKEKNGKVIDTSKFDAFVANTTKKIKDWFKDLPNKIQKALKSTGSFFAKLYEVIDEFLFGKKVSAGQMSNQYGANVVSDTRLKSGFSKLLDNVIDAVKRFIKDIPNYIRNGIKSAGDIVSSIVGAIFGRSDGKAITANDIVNKLKSPFANLDLSGVLDTIQGIGTELLNQIVRIFTGSESIDFNMDWISQKVAEGIEWVRSKAEIALAWVSEFLVTFPTTIADFFNGEDAGAQEKGPIGLAIANFGAAIGGFIEDLPEKITTFFDNAILGIGSLWDRLYNAITGAINNYQVNAGDEVEKTLYPDAMKGDPRYHVKSKWESFVESIGKLISDAFQELPKWITQGIELAVGAIDLAMTNLSVYLEGINAGNVIKDESGNILDGTAKKIKDSGANEEPEIVTAVKAIGERIGHLFSETMPRCIGAAWTWGKEQIKIAFDGIKNIFSDDAKDRAKEAVSGFGTTIYDFLIKDVPKAIGDAIGAVSKIITDLFGKKDEKDKDDLSYIKDPEVRAYAEKYRDAHKKIIDEVDEEIESMPDDDNPAIVLVDKLKEGFATAVSTLGPVILQGIKTAVDTLNTVSGVIFDALTGKKSIADAVGDTLGDQGDEVREKITSLGESLKTFFMESTPKLIGSAIGELIQQAPQWIDTLFDAIGGAMADCMDDIYNQVDENGNPTSGTAAGSPIDTAKKTITDVSELVMNFLSSPVLNSGVKLLAGLLLVVEILKMIKEITAAINPITSYAEAQESKNSVEAVFKKALTALIAGMALAAYASSLSPDQFEQTKEIFSKLTELLESLAAFYTFNKTVSTVGEGVSDISGMATAIWGKNGAKDLQNTAQQMTKGQKLLNGMADTATGMMKTAGGALAGGAAVEILGSAANDVFQQFLGTFAELGPAVNAFASGFGDAVKKFSEVKDKIDTAIQVLNNAVTIASKAHEIVQYKDDVKDAKQVFGDLTESVGLFAQSFKGVGLGVKWSVEGIDMLIGLMGKITDFVQFTEKDDTFSKFKYALATLGSAMTMMNGSTVNSVGTLNDEMIQSAASALSKLLSDEGLIAVSKKLTQENTFGGDAAKMYENTEGLIVFATAIMRLGEATVGFTSEKGEAIKEFIQSIDGIYLNEGSTDLAGKFVALGTGLASFKDAVRGFKQEEVEAAGYALDMLTGIAERVNRLGHGLLASLIVGNDDLSTFGNAIGALGTNLKSFLDAVDPIGADGKRVSRSADNVRIGMMALMELANAAQILPSNRVNELQKLGSLLGNTTEGENFAEQIVAFITRLSTMTSGVKNELGLKDVDFTVVNQAIDVIYKLTRSMSLFADANGSIGNILEEFGKGLWNVHFTSEDEEKQQTEFGLLARIAKGFREFSEIIPDDLDINLIMKSMEAIRILTDGLANMYVTSTVLSFSESSATLVEGTKAIDEIMNALDEFSSRSETLEKFFKVADTIPLERVEAAKNIFESIGSLGSALMTFGQESLAGVGNMTRNGLNNLLTINPDDIVSAVSPMLDAYNTLLNDSTIMDQFKDTGASISVMISEGIQGAINDPDQNLQPTITPVIDLTQAKEDLAKFFGATNTEEFNFGQIAQAVSSAISVANEPNEAERAFYSDAIIKLSGIEDGVKSLYRDTATVGDVSNAFTRIRIVTDTGALAGALTNDIDAMIGDKIWLITRGNAVSV